jgi:hypothetical protein
VQTNCVFGLDFYKKFLPWQFTCRDFLYSSFLLQAREAAIAVQGKWWIYSVRKEKVCYLVLLQFFWAFVSVEKLDNYDMEYVWYYNLKC